MHLFERNGNIADPMYHNSGDLSDRPGYDFEQIKLIMKAEVRNTSFSKQVMLRLTVLLFHSSLYFYTLLALIWKIDEL